MVPKGKGSITYREGPGPGAYQSRTIFHNIVGASTFGRNKKTGENDPEAKSAREIPGPGTYSGNYRAMSKNDP